MTIEEAIAALEKIREDKPIFFDWCFINPAAPASYRGDYSKLAISFNLETSVNVATVREWLKASLFRAFEGYKGGTYRMLPSTDIYVARWGETGREIIGIEDKEYAAIIKTKDY